MTQDEARERSVAYLIQNADEALQSAKAEATAGRLRFAMNRVYYASFYSASAVLAGRGRHFVKHAGLRAALHRDLVKTGELSLAMGAFYDEVFTERQEADYGAFVEFELADVQARIEQAEAFVAEIKRLIANCPGGESATTP